MLLFFVVIVACESFVCEIFCLIYFIAILMNLFTHQLARVFARVFESNRIFTENTLTQDYRNCMYANDTI